MDADKQPACDAAMEIAECLVEANEFGALGVLIASLHVEQWSPEAMLCFLLVAKREIRRRRSDGYDLPDSFVWFYERAVERFVTHVRSTARPDAEAILGLVTLGPQSNDVQAAMRRIIEANKPLFDRLGKI